MKLSCRWLDELVGLDDRPAADVAQALTFHTAAVEGIEEVGAGLDGVVTGRVTAVRPHPGADRLRLCTVDTGSGEPTEVVCGAPNVAEGQMICYASVGLTLPNGVKLKRAKIRGVVSAGMVCAEDELGLGDDHAGIIVLPPDTPLGIPVADALGVRDHVLEVDNPDLTHRPDLWGHVGFARELGALFGRTFEEPATPLADRALAEATGEPFPVAIEDPEGCRRYVGIVVENVTNRASPASLRFRLEALGMRSIDLLVDLTNLVMLEQGQPLHAFDIRDVRGERIVVRRAGPGETMRTLDGEERTLREDDLLIADGERAVAIAGVMGGENSEVRPDTTTILLEAANFDAVRIRRTATRLGLRTESSSRFEKALDPVSAEKAARRFLQLLLEHVPDARVVRRMADAYPRPYPAVRLALPHNLVGRRLGTRVTGGEVRAHLGALGFRLRETDNGFDVDVPSWRATKDVSLPEDLVEEVGRIRGYADIPAVPPVGALTPTRPSPMRRLERRLANALSLDLGYAEVKTYAYHGPREVEQLGIADVRHLHVQNPQSADQDRMAQTAAAGLLGAASRNAARAPRGRLWESTRLIFPRPDGAVGDLPVEVPVVAAVVWDTEAQDDPEGRVFRSLVEDVRATLEAAPTTAFVVRDGGDATPAEGLPIPVWLHPGRRAVFESDGRVVAVVAEAAPAVLRAFDLPGRAALAEVNLESVLAGLAPSGAGYVPIHRYPIVPFDVSVVVPRRTPAARVAETIAAVSDTAVRGVALFDVYEGQGIPEGQRSLAFSCELLDPQATLTTKKADKLRQRIVKALEREGWTVRAG